MATAAELAKLKAQLAALKTARNTGVLSVMHGDTRTQYRSLDEMDRIIATLENEVAAATDSAPRVRSVRVHDRSGW